MSCDRKESSRRYYLNNRLAVLRRVRKYRKNNREEIKSRARKKYATNESFRNRMAEYQKKYRKENSEKINCYQRKYRNGVYRDRFNAIKRRWSKTAKGRLKSQLNGFRRRMLIRECSTKHTVDEWVTLLKKHGGKCVQCGSRKNIEKDHKIPLSKGGGNSIDNIQPLCGRCNRKKSDKLTAKK